MIDTAQAFGVDIGGSGIKAAPVNLENGKNKIKDEFIAQQADGPTCLSVIS